MANCFSQLHIQLVFAVKYRDALILPAWKDRLHQYIGGIFRANGNKLLQINSMPDHIHIFSGWRPNQCISSVVQNLKSQTSVWINENQFCEKKFRWQEGYGVFSYSKWDIDKIVNYIKNQETHHRVKTFHEEFQELLIENSIPFDQQYLFHLPI